MTAPTTESPVTPTPGTPAPAAMPSVNSWDDARSLARNLGTPTPSAPPTAPDHPAAPASDQGTKATSDTAPPTSATTPPTKPETPPAIAKPGSTPGAPFKVVAPEGTDITWPEGATVSFQVEGKTVEVSSLGQLVQDASVGRKLAKEASNFGRREAQWKHDLASAQTTATTERQQLLQAWEATAERLFAAAEKAIAGDQAEWEQVVHEWRRGNDPDIKAGREAQAKLAAAEKANAERQAQEDRAQVEAFWQGVEAEVATKVSGGEYEYLTDEDVVPALERLNQDYRETLASLDEKLGAQRTRFNGTDAEWQAMLDKAAVQAVFTTERLAAHLQQMNDSYATRLQPHVTRRSLAEQAAEAAKDAAAHNQRTEMKISQQARASVRSTGTPPGVSPGGTEEKPVGWEATKKGILAELHR